VPCGSRQDFCDLVAPVIAPLAARNGLRFSEEGAALVLHPSSCFRDFPFALQSGCLRVIVVGLVPQNGGQLEKPFSQPQAHSMVQSSAGDLCVCVLDDSFLAKVPVQADRDVPARGRVRAERRQGPGRKACVTVKCPVLCGTVLLRAKSALQ
jgi:hypothetical protein